MKTYKMTIAYDGSGFAGYQVQPGQRTVQAELEKALKKIHKGTPIHVTASGRTDSKVHAKGQVIHFDSPYILGPSDWRRALNALLPGDIAIVEAEEAEPGFHARFHAAGKEYRYMIWRPEVKDPFKRDYMYHYPWPLDINAMKAAAAALTGTHDFTSFCSVKTEVQDKVRTLDSIEIIEKGPVLELQFKGNGFLYNMVRILTGTLLDAGAGRKKPDEFPGILGAKDRSRAGKTAPGHGLYLWKVHYPKVLKKNPLDN